MKSLDFETQKQDLQNLSNALNERAAKLRDELVEVETHASRIASAVAALEGKGANTSTSIGIKKRKANKPSASIEVVLQLLTAILHQVPSPTDSQLLELLKDQVAKKGFSRMGLKAKYEEAILSKEFMKTNGVISLASVQKTA